MFRTRATASKPKSKTIHRVATRSAPVGGINARDGLAAMPELDAVDLVNWIPDTGGIRCRKGYSEWAINFPGAVAVEGIAAYFAPNTTFPGGAFLSTPTSMPGKLFAATKTAIYDITNATNAPVSVKALSGADTAGWISSVMLTNSAGSFLLVCSEMDGYFTYDGTTWTKITLGAGASQVSVVDPTTFVHVTLWKRRAWFVQKNTTKAAYLPVDSLYGAAASFDFGPLFKHGGHLSYIANWTIDAGEGVDDLLVVVGSNGDVLVYKGTDPTSATTFALVGSWFVGQIPVGRRAYTQFGGDLVICSADGIFPISYVTRGGSEFLVASAKEYSSKIRPLIGADLRSSFSIRGWQMLLHPSERILVIGVPDYGSIVNRQWAMSTSLSAWCRFANIPAYCYGSTAGYAFAGTLDGKVLLLYTGYYDAVAYGASVGNGIAGEVYPAFSTFDAPALIKQFLMVRPTFVSASEPSSLTGISVDYKIATPTGATPYAALTGALWNTGIWNTSLWAGSTVTFGEWESVGDYGFSGAAAIRTSCIGDTVLAAIDYMYQVGGPL